MDGWAIKEKKTPAIWLFKASSPVCSAQKERRTPLVSVKGILLWARGSYIWAPQWQQNQILILCLDRYPMSALGKLLEILWFCLCECRKQNVLAALNSLFISSTHRSIRTLYRCPPSLPHFPKHQHTYTHQVQPLSREFSFLVAVTMETYNVRLWPGLQRPCFPPKASNPVASLSATHSAEEASRKVFCC